MNSHLLNKRTKVLTKQNDLTWIIFCRRQGLFHHQLRHHPVFCVLVRLRLVHQHPGHDRHGHDQHHVRLQLLLLLKVLLLYLL